MIYHAPTLPNGQAFAFQAGITVSNGAVSATDYYVASGTTTPIVIADVAPPAIAGTVANEPIASGDKIRPFATLHITSPYLSYNYSTIIPGVPYNTYSYGPSYYYNPEDKATITITDGAQATDADGLLTGPGLSKTGVGTYSLGSVNAYNLQSQLDNLSFQTIALAAAARQMAGNLHGDIRIKPGLSRYNYQA